VARRRQRSAARLRPSPKSAANPDGLPVGLAKQPNGNGIGTSCAACHEAEITFRGQTMRVHGGQGRSTIKTFFTEAYTALVKQTLDPLKFARFAKRVNDGKDMSASDLALLLKTITSTAALGISTLEEDIEELGEPKCDPGPFRVDAVGGGINALVGQIKKSNLHRANAPVSVPHLWDTHSFDWVEWNGAFQQPMTRNVISSLARHAEISFTDDGKPGLANSVAVVEMDRMETALTRLHPPKWPEAILGAIDRAKAERGRAIYTDKVKCGACHDAPVGKDGLRQITMTPLEDIGTDPRQATNWANRKVDMDGRFGLGVIPVTDFARFTTQGVLDRNYAELGIPPERQAQMNGFRPNGWRAPLAYRARPLEGTWATGPYLHNGSVPTLAELLLPAEERPVTFNIGSREMDPVGVGLVTAGDFVFDTRIDGNRNTGHSGPRYGTDLPPEERADLLEYLKTL
jgi:hypothetical protein